MPYYLVEASFSPPAMSAFVQNPQDKPHLVEAALEKLGGKLEGVWFAFGEHDLVLICQVPSDETMAAFSMATLADGSLHTVKTTSLLSWSEGLNALRRAAEVGYR